MLAYAAEYGFSEAHDWPDGLEDDNHRSLGGFHWETFLHENLARALNKIVASSSTAPAVVV